MNRFHLVIYILQQSKIAYLTFMLHDVFTRDTEYLELLVYVAAGGYLSGQKTTYCNALIPSATLGSQSSRLLILVRYHYIPRIACYSQYINRYRQAQISYKMLLKLQDCMSDHVTAYQHGKWRRQALLLPTLHMCCRHREHPACI